MELDTQNSRIVKHSCMICKKTFITRIYSVYSEDTANVLTFSDDLRYWKWDKNPTDDKLHAGILLDSDLESF